MLLKCWHGCFWRWCKQIYDAIRIPDGYTRVEYIESTGTQWINTGYIPTSTNTKYDIHIYSPNVPASGEYQDIIGYWRSGGGSSCTIEFYNTYIYMYTKQLNFSDNTIGGGPYSTNRDFWITASLNETNATKTLNINGATYTGSIGVPQILFTEIKLFTANTTHNNFVGRFYYCKIYDNGTLVRSFIPVRDSNNVGYMFDEVTGQLFGNDGSGSFGIGNDLPTAKVRFIQDVIPSSYLPLKYLESTGTQYIDTGIYGTPTLKTTLDMQQLEINTETSGKGIFGCYNSNTANCYYFYQKGRGVTEFFWQCGFGNYVNTNSPIDTNRHTVLFDNYKVYLDGTILNTFTSNTLTTTPQTLLLFNTHNATGGIYNALSQRFFSCKMEDNGTLVRDFYPALRKSDNKPGMYDRITKQFFVNQGTGEFNYG